MPSGKNISKQRKTQVMLMVGALLLMFVGLPVGLYMANGFNGFLSGVNTWTEVENTTAFYDGPILDGDDEYRYASYNGTTVTEETPTWDTVTEWDSITIAGTGTNNKVVFNYNKTVDELLNSKINQIRFKLNSSNRLKVTVNAVKWDGVTLTSVQAYSVSHVDNESSTLYWNVTPVKALGYKNDLSPAATDEVYFQIILEGFDATNYLTAGDTIQFQIAEGSSSNAYAFSNIQILRGSVTILGLIFVLVGFASTPYWNPTGAKKKGGK